MSSMTTAAPPVETEIASGSVTPERMTKPLKRLFGFSVPLFLSVYLIVGAIPGVLLPLQVAGIDEANKVGNLALITGIGAIVAMIASPIAGLISDRTRSRFGRRAPWLVVGALTTGLTLVGMGFANGVVQLVIGWSIAQLFLNLLISPLSAIMPDRVPAPRRGVFSALVGIGTMLGAIGGQSVGAAFAGNVPMGYFVIPGIAIVVAVLFVVFCRESSTLEMEREPFSLKVLLQMFWVSPRRHPDFAWGFLGRLFLYTGYFAITGYQLYLLQDYIGLGDNAIGMLPLLGLINVTALMVSTAVSGPLSDRFQRRKVFVIAASLIMALGMVIPVFLPSVTGMVLFSIVVGLGFGAYAAVDGALMSELLPSSGTYAKDLGVLNLAATLPQTLSPFVGGAIVLAFGYVALFPIGIVLAVLGALAIIPIKSVR
jgi:MFS family permease